MRHLRRLLRHPFIAIPPFIVLLGLIWHYHTTAGRESYLPLQTSNLFATMAPNIAPQNGLPAGWQTSQHGSAVFTTSHVLGYASAQATKLTVNNYESGNITLTSPKTTVKPDQNYLFKGYYTSDMPFALLARYYYSDGTDNLVHIKIYPEQKGSWSSASHAFTTGKQITAVQFVYKIAHNGSLTVDGVYLEPRDNVFISSPNSTAQNIIPNVSLSTSSIEMPDNWSSYRTGDNMASFAVQNDEKGAYTNASANNFRSGEVKWQFTPQPVLPNQRYQFSAEYRSDTPAKVVAESVLNDGSRRFDTLAELLPADEWTKITYPIETRSSIVTMSVSLVLYSNGSLAGRDYSLAQQSSQNTSQWKRPLISITFDDGWRSAYSNGLPLLDRYKYEATFYISPLSIETPGYMYASDLAQLREMNQEIAIQGYSHKDMTTLNSAVLEEQLRQGKEYMANAGFATTHFAPPYGKSDAEVQWFAHHYFTTLRGMESGINTQQNFDPYNLRVVSLDKSTDTEALSRALARTQSAKGWLILVYHNIGDESSAASQPPTISTETFANHLDQIKKSDITVLPIGKAYEEVSKP